MYNIIFALILMCTVLLKCKLTVLTQNSILEIQVYMNFENRELRSKEYANSKEISRKRFISQRKNNSHSHAMYKNLASLATPWHVKNPNDVTVNCVYVRVPVASVCKYT